MIDEGDERGNEAPFSRSYDFFKYMTGVALLSLGGVFAFADGGVQFDPRQLVIVLAFIGLAGVTSLLMAASLATLEVKSEPHAKVVRRIRVAQIAVSFLISGGLGAFVFNFTSAMLK